MNKNRLIIFLILLTVIGFGWGFYETNESVAKEKAVENMRGRAFYDLLDSVEKLSVLSSKTLVSADSSNLTELLSQINTEAYVAQENLCQLPLYHNALMRTEKFLNQMGDFSHSLIKNTEDGYTLTSEERETLLDLNAEVEKVSMALHDLEQSDDDPFAWKTTVKAEREIASNNLSEASAAQKSFSEVTTNLDKVPSLTYDGPFSDDLENAGPLELEGEETSWDAALALAKDLFGDSYTYESYGSSSKNAGIPVYSVSLLDNEETVVGYLDVSAVGCHPVQYTGEQYNNSQTISIDEGLNIAEDFINTTEYQNMVRSYYLTENNVLTVNFVYSENDICVYPDMIKVSVDLTSKKIVGFDAKSYLRYHRDRDYAPEILSPDEARSHLAADLTPVSEQLAIIPLDNGDEALTYEYRIKGDNHEYLIYLNAATGSEEDILLLLSSDMGTITM